MNESTFKSVVSFTPSPDVLHLSLGLDPGQAGYEVLLKINGVDKPFEKLKPDATSLTIAAELGAKVDFCIFPINNKGVPGPGTVFGFVVRNEVPPKPIAWNGAPIVTKVLPPLPVVLAEVINKIDQGITSNETVVLPTIFVTGHSELNDDAEGTPVGWDAATSSIIVGFPKAQVKTGSPEKLLKTTDPSFSGTAVYATGERISLGAFAQRQYGIPEAEQLSIPTT